MKINILMPRLGANDNFVTLCKWNIKEGDFVSKGQVIAQIETTKESGEIEADENGYIHLIATRNQSVAVGDVICEICDTYEMPIEKTEQKEHHQKQTISAKAQKLMDEHGIGIEEFADYTIIREKDVLEFLQSTSSADDVIEWEESLENKLLINGGGGFCKVILEVLAQRGEYRVDGILDKKYPELSEVKGIKVIRSNNEEDMCNLYQQGYRMMINAIGFNGNEHNRKEPYAMIKKCGYKVPNVIHNKAIIEPSVRIGEGNLILAGAVLGTDVQIGNNCIINVGAILSHDCSIGNHSHIASGTVLGGGVKVGENTLIGQGCTVFKDVRIGKNVVIANGVNVFENIPDGAFIR